MTRRARASRWPLSRNCPTRGSSPLPASPSRRGPTDRREALRGCRGRVLRQEVFGLDAPATGATPDERRRQLTPYSVVTHNWLVEWRQPPLNGHHGAVAVTESERITFAYDREPADPRVEHTLNVKVDELGNVLESATVAYARRVPDAALPAAVGEAQARTWITYTHNEFTNDVVDRAHHRRRRASRTSTYELTGLTRAGALHGLADFERPGFSALTSSTEIPHHDDEHPPPAGTVFRRLLTRKETLFYDATLQAPAPLHTIDARALPYESYELAYTSELLTDIFAARATPAVMGEGRYVHRGDAHWWATSGRWEYLEAGEAPAAARGRFFAHVAQRDPFGARVAIGHLGDHFLLREETVDAAGNRVRATAFDLRTLSPRRVVDANGNVSEVLFDELGWLKASAVLGKGAEGDDLSAHGGWATPADDALSAALFAAPSSLEVTAAAAGLLGDASVRHVYDFHRHRTSGGKLPPVVATIVREQHVAAQPASPVQVSFEYSNGSGAVELTKAQAEPGLAARTTVAEDGTVTVQAVDTAALVPPRLRWLGTGRKVVNNKGNPVKEYEPFFSVTHEFENARELVETGVAKIREYDPIDRLVRVEHPDATFELTEYGPWSVSEYDANDTIKRSRWHELRVNHEIDAALVAAGKDPNREAAAAAQTEAHAETPLRRHLDPLSRPVLEVQHAGFDAAGVPRLRATTYRRDLGGRALAVTDPRGNLTIAYRYDMRGTLARYDSADSGVRLTLENVVGEPLRAWDERGHELAFSYEDPLHRLTAKRVRGGDGPVPLDHVFERIVYGEGRPGDTAANLRTRIALHYDSAGRTEQTGFDFKGNLVSASRRFATDYRAVPDWAGADPDAALDAEPFASACTYDALNRKVERTAPDGSVHRAGYNAANLLETVRVTQGAVSELDGQGDRLRRARPAPADRLRQRRHDRLPLRPRDVPARAADEPQRRRHRAAGPAPHLRPGRQPHPPRGQLRPDGLVRQRDGHGGVHLRLRPALPAGRRDRPRARRPDDLRRLRQRLRHPPARPPRPRRPPRVAELHAALRLRRGRQPRAGRPRRAGRHRLDARLQLRGRQATAC